MYIATGTEQAELVARYGISPAWATYLTVVATSVGGSPLHLAKVINHESRWNPKAQYGFVDGPPNGVFLPGLATGIIQFIPSTAIKLGTTTRAIFDMSFEQQIGLVQKYLQLVASGQWAGGGSGPLDTQEKMALAVFYPALRNYPLTARLPPAAAAANPGVATIGDYVDRVLGRGALKRQIAVVASTGVGAGLGIAAIVGFGLYLLSSSRSR